MLYPLSYVRARYLRTLTRDYVTSSGPGQRGLGSRTLSAGIASSDRTSERRNGRRLTTIRAAGDPIGTITSKGSGSPLTWSQWTSDSEISASFIDRVRKRVRWTSASG